MALTLGTRLGVYEVTAQIGAGGMGEVYRATDSNLKRSVAIKVLPAAVAGDADRLARFQREAEVLAALNHPNIAAIYGFERSSDRTALVMELVEGEDLSQRIARGAVPIAEALPIAKQIAEALEAAHEQGIIHRDLKPANIKLRSDGTVKVLDFGLAKAMDPSSSSPANAMNSPTLSMHATMQGVILGTAAYMAPEQARGKAVDKRADIWAFGCVLFECLAGRQLFAGETVSDTIAKILEREPDWAALPAQTPSKVRELLRRCLEKDAKKRQRDIGDVRIELEEAAAARSSSTGVAAAAGRNTTLAALSPRTMALAALLVVVGGAVGIWLWNTVGLGAPVVQSAVGGPVRLSIGIPPGIHAVADRGTHAGITPDGQTLIVVGFPRKPDGTEDARAQIYTRRLNDYELKPIPGTEGVQSYTMSPDGRSLAFVATISVQSSQRRLAKAPVDGSSPPVTLVDWDSDWSTSVVWLEDGDILVASNNGTKFFRLPSSGGSPKAAMKIDTGPLFGSAKFGNRLPADRGVFFSMETWGPRGYQQDEWLLDPKTGRAIRLFESAGNAVYVPTGYIVFTRGDAMMAVPFDLARLAVTSEVTAMFGGVRTPNSWDNGGFEISRNGTLVFPPGGRLGTDRRLVTVDAAGNVAPFARERRGYEIAPAASRDGRKAAVIVPSAKGTYETWVSDLGRPGLKRVLAFANADAAIPVWSPDGQRLAYHRTARDKDDGVYVQRADGGGSPQAVLMQESLEVNIEPSSWAPDGSGLIVSKTVGGKGDILFVQVPTGGEPGKPRVLRATPYHEHSARFSPDGRLVAFVSDESGKAEVYVASYDADGALGPPVAVSNGGGLRPGWASDSRRLFYYVDPDKVVLATIETRPSLSASAPAMAHDLKKLRVNPLEWDVLPEGHLLAIQKGEGEDDITTFNVVLNWFDELKARLSKK